MPSYSFDEIMRDLKNKVYHPVYLLQGDEPYYIDQVTDFISANVLSENEKEFNQSILYGRDIDLLSLVSAAKRYPMMANYQVVIIKEAQDIKNLLPRESKDREKKGDGEDKNPLLQYLHNPLKSTLLVFCYKYKSIDRRTRVGKIFDKAAAVFESKKLYDNKIADWVSAYVKSKNYRISTRAALLIGDYIGSDLTRIVNELDKMMLNVRSETEIDIQHVEENIGISKEFNVFELQNALGNKNILKANRIINYFGANTKNNPLPMTLANLSGYFNKIMFYHSLPDKSRRVASTALGVHEFFIGDYEKAARNYSPRKVELIFHHLREYDMRSKGVGGNNEAEGELLKELIFKILH
jgi:DNA polymerase-3 subunit delta